MPLAQASHAIGLPMQVHKELISFASKSTNGRGGMLAKVEAAWMAAEQGCSVVILNGKKPDSILQVPPLVRVSEYLPRSSRFVMAVALLRTVS